MILKYKVFMDPGLTTREILHKFLIVMGVSGLLVLFYTIFSLLGKRRLEKELED